MIKFYFLSLSLCTLLASRLNASESIYNIAPDYVCSDYERPIVVCISSCDIKCLESVYAQKYTNFRVIYIHNGAYDQVVNYVEDNGYNDMTMVITNDQEETIVSKHYLMSHYCEDDEIVVSIDSGDYFTTDNALQTINKAYMDEDVWLTYGQFHDVDKSICLQGRAIFKHKLLQKIMRKMSFVSYQPRTYYALLFKNIPKEYLMDEGEFLSESGNVAIMTFLIDLATKHTYFLSAPIYGVSENADSKRFLPNFKEERIIKMKKPLTELDTLFST